MRKAIAVVLITFGTFALSGCTADNEAQRVLSGQGYSDIKLTGYRVLTCSDDDTFHTGFTARSISGAKVSGTVCSGIIKGATIRLD